MRFMMAMGVLLMACSNGPATRADLCDAAIAGVCDRWAECFPGEAASAPSDCHSNPAVAAAIARLMCPAGTEQDAIETDPGQCYDTMVTQSCSRFRSLEVLPPAVCVPSRRAP